MHGASVGNSLGSCAGNSLGESAAGASGTEAPSPFWRWVEQVIEPPR
jgi:hypothetical protein